ncbi:aspartyl-phosphate phosphatase Spo0E family protein [Aquibacillus kalidii]|uniref:aspartyl-phosphate phosphatase Spo0E family protein n=1 Tax=Aquibacillus kalidii TaxID=2762597 RepID=UPI001649776C|nr:aspartyl-phosphate phosphatase Spo0E family protein [Aquibacillus kalidii]
MYNPNNLLERIEYLRKKMTDVALNKGFTSTESILISQELDRLLNQYHEFKKKKEDKFSPNTNREK